MTYFPLVVLVWLTSDYGRQKGAILGNMLKNNSNSRKDSSNIVKNINGKKNKKWPKIHRTRRENK